MAKSARKTKQKTKPITSNVSPKPSQKSESVEPVEDDDFGGLPKRDLKKNLGCG